MDPRATQTPGPLQTAPTVVPPSTVTFQRHRCAFVVSHHTTEPAAHYTPSSKAQALPRQNEMDALLSRFQGHPIPLPGWPRLWVRPNSPLPSPTPPLACSKAWMSS